MGGDFGGDVGGDGVRVCVCVYIIYDDVNVFFAIFETCCVCIMLRSSSEVIK